VTFPLALAFAFAMVIQAAIPGPGVFATVARSLSGGLRSGFAVICGIVVGDIVYALLAVFALTAVARHLGNLFVIIKLCGAAYLIWVGLRLWFRKPAEVQAEEDSRHSLIGSFANGLITTLANPKAILFYGGFLPAFFDLSRFTTSDTLALVSIVVAVLGAVLALYALLAAFARGLFRSRRALRRMNRVAGSVMIATGIVVAARR